MVVLEEGTAGDDESEALREIKSELKALRRKAEKVKKNQTSLKKAVNSMTKQVRRITVLCILHFYPPPPFILFVFFFVFFCKIRLEILIDIFVFAMGQERLYFLSMRFIVLSY